MNGPTNLSETLTFFLDEYQIALVPIRAGEKKPRGTGWNATTDHPRSKFSADSNAGILLGAPVGSMAGYHIYDVDIDLNEDWARKIVAFCCPDTGWVFGRVGKPNSHRVYVAQEIIEGDSYLGLDGKTALEFRGKAKRDKFTHTVAPGCVWTSKDGQHTEPIRFLEPIGALARVDGPGLFRSVQLAAVGLVIGQCWPAGERHKACLAWAGVLKDNGVTEDECRLVLEAVTDALEGEPWADARTCARDTYSAKPDAHLISTGWIRDTITPLGAQAIDLVRKHLGFSGSNAAAVDEAVERMNATHFGVRVGKDYVFGRFDDDMPVFQAPGALRLEYAAEKVHVGTKNGAPVIKPLVEVWIESPQRKNYARAVFAPPGAVKQAGAQDLNLYRGPILTDAILAKRNPILVAPFLDHVQEIICDGNSAHFAFLQRVLANLYRYPGRPSEVAVSMRGGHGSGKGQMFAVPLGEVFGAKHFFHAMEVDHLTKQFNAHLSGVVFLFADEAIWNDSKRASARLKAIITEKTMSIERKGLDVITEPSCLHLFTATNYEHSAPKEIGDRRWFTLAVSDRHAEGRDGRAEYFARLDACVTHPDFREALLAEVYSWGDVPRVGPIPKSDEGNAQIDYGLEPELKWWKDCLIEGRIEDQPWPTRITFDDLHVAYRRWSKGVVKELLDRTDFNARMERFVQRGGETQQTALEPFVREVTPWNDGKIIIDVTSAKPERMGQRRRAWKVATLDEARLRWNALTGQKIDWAASDALAA